jgi:hypothetical protein
MPFVWDDEDDRRKWCEVGMYIFSGMLVAVLITVGIINMTGYTSQLVFLDPNGTLIITNPGRSDGVIMIVAGCLVFPLCIVVMRLLKLEQDRRALGMI